MKEVLKSISRTLALLVLFLHQMVYASGKLFVCKEEMGTVDLKEYAHLAVIDDISDLSQKFLTKQAKFAPFQLSSISGNHAGHVLKLSILNPGSEDVIIYTSSFFIDKVRVFEYDTTSGLFQEQNSVNGYLIPPQERTVYYSQSSIVPIYLQARSSKTYYIVTESHTQRGRNVSRASFKMGFIGYDQRTFHKVYDTLGFVNIFMVGVVTILILYNLLISIGLKDDSMIYLVFYNFCFFCWVFLFGGMVIRFNLTEDLNFERTLRYLVPNTLLPIGYCLLFYSFLKLRKNFRFLGAILIGATVLHSVFNILNIFIDHNALIQFIQILAPIIYSSALLASFLSFLKQSSLSGYFLVGSILMIIGLGVQIYGYSSPNLNYLYGHIFIEIVIFLEIVVFSIAVTNKLWLIKKRSIELAAEKSSIQNELERKNRELISFTTQQIVQNDRLDKVRTKLSKNGSVDPISLKEFTKEIDKMKNFDHNWEGFRFQFENVNPSFFKILSRKHPTLTPNESRLCALLKLGLKRKEIAGVLGVSIRAVDKALERLKKKLELSPEIRLFDYVNSKGAFE